MEKIGVFGGTFNPPHKGHLHAAEEVKHALGLDRVIFVPDANPPHKDLPEGSPTPRQRLELVRAAVRNLHWAEVSDMELSRSGKSYTADTLRLLKEKYPADTLYLITGSDMFLTLHKWARPEEICRCAVIVGHHRKEKDSLEEFLAQKQRLERDFGATVELVENRVLEISSTKTRRLLILGGAEKYVPEPVLEIIENQKLYGVGRDYRNLSDEALREIAVSLLKPKRVNHVLGCAETAVKLARRWGADERAALRAGLLHDVTKAIDGEDQLLLVDKYAILISDFERNYPKVLHAKTGAAVAEHVFGERGDVVSAIYWHTTGKADMSLLEKIVYLADYIEPNRGFDGVEGLRELAFQDLDLTLLRSFEMVIDELIREKKRLCRETPEALEFLRKQRAAEAAKV